VTITRTDTTTAGGTANNWTVATPSGSGGLFVIYCMDNGGASAPTGFTQLIQQRFGGNGQYINVFWREADGTEGSSFTSTDGGDTSGWSVECVRYAGAATSSPIDAYAGTASSTGGASPKSMPATGITTTAANDLVVYAGGLGSYSGVTSPTFTPPSGFTSPATPPTGGSANLCVSEAIQVTAGATGTKTASGAFTGGTCIGFGAVLLAIKAAAGDVTVGLTGQSITSGQGTVTVASTGVTVALTGQAVTSGQGAFTQAVSNALTGRSITSGRGTLKGTVSKSLTGSAVTSGQGATVPALAPTLTGQVGTTGAGGVTPDAQVAVTGLSETASQGSVTPESGGIAVALSGQMVTAAQGDVTPALSQGLAGQSVTITQGAVTAVPEVRIALSGQSISVQIGTVQPAFTAPVDGQDANYAQGVLTATAGHDVSVGLTGTGTTAAQGELAASASVGLLGSTFGTTQGGVSPISSMAMAGRSAVFIAGTLTSNGKLIIEPGRIAILPPETRIAALDHETRTAILPPEQRIARLTA